MPKKTKRNSPSPKNKPSQTTPPNISQVVGVEAKLQALSGPLPLPSTLQEFDNVVFKLEKGVISEIASSPYGFHLFVVEDTREEQYLLIEEVRSDIIETIRRIKAER